MKKLLLFALALCMGGGLDASAQEVSQQKIDSLNRALDEISTRLQQTETFEINRAIWKNRSRYFNLSYVKQTLSPDIKGWDVPEDSELKSDIGAALVWGKTYYLHRKPLARMIKFGLDWSWMDLNYARYKLADFETGEDASQRAHQLEYGMQIGPSVTINPIHHLKVSAYFRVTPSYSMIYRNEDLYHHYATFCNTGFAVAWKVLSVGCEWRWGKANYNGLSVNLDDLMGDFDDSGFDGDLDIPSADDVLVSLEKMKLKTKSVRIYLSFRF